MNRKDLTILCNTISLAIAKPNTPKYKARTVGYQCGLCGEYNKPDYMWSADKCVDCYDINDIQLLEERELPHD